MKEAASSSNHQLTDLISLPIKHLDFRPLIISNTIAAFFPCSERKMGFIQYLWLSSHNHLFFNFFFLSCLLCVTCLHAQSCSQEQSSALLQFSRNFSINQYASLRCDKSGTPSHPKSESWKEGTDCCSWHGVECDNETGRVIGLDLSCSWLQGTIHPNSTLFHYFPHLQRLNLSSNDFDNSRISSTSSRFTRLTHLDLSHSRFSGEVPIEVSFMTNLVCLDLSWNDDLRLGKTRFELLVQNLSRIRELNLYGVNIPSVVPSFLLNVTSLTSLNLSSVDCMGNSLMDYSTYHT